MVAVEAEAVAVPVPAEPMPAADDAVPSTTAVPMDEDGVGSGKKGRSPETERASRASRLERQGTVSSSDEYYLQGEVSRQLPALPPPRAGRKFHLFVSAHNPGAAELARAAGVAVKKDAVQVM